MICIVVEADFIVLLVSSQFTTVPFKCMLTESIDNVEIRGEVPGAEFLTKVNMEEFTTICLD